jgi:hypothetical protein
LILEDFVDDATVESLKSECHRLIEEMNPADHNTVFSTLEMKRVGLIQSLVYYTNTIPKQQNVVLCRGYLFVSVMFGNVFH